MTPRTKRLCKALIRVVREAATAFEKWVEEAPVK